MSLTALMDRLSGDVQKRTVTEVSKGVAQLGKGLRSFAVTVTRSYEETIDNVVDKSKGLLDGFRDMATKARTFAQNLRTLRDMNLDPRLFAELVQAGVEAGGATAQALVDGGSDTVKEISNLFGEIDTLGGELGFEVSQNFYDAGESLIDQLLAGMRAQQTALENQAIAMANTFAANFKPRLDVAINAAVTSATTAAEAVAEAAKNELEVPEIQIDQSALDTLKRLIERANQYIINLGGTNLTATAGAVVKRDLYQQLYDMVASGTRVDLTGIESGLSAAELTQRAAGAGANVSNITINVNASGYAGGAQAGQAVVEEIKNFERYNGTVGKFLLQAQAV
jgi:hypothetical protein